MLQRKWAAYMAVTILSCLFISVECVAQTPASATMDSLLTKVFITDELLPMLIDSAIKYSPQASVGRNNESRIKATYNINRRSIYNALSLRTSLGYGSNFSAINNQSASLSENYTTGSSAFYSIGFGLQLPINQIINRKDINKVEKAIVETAVADKEKAFLFIKQEVVRTYQNLKLAHKLLGISIKNKESAEINNTLGQKNFLNGQITVDQILLINEGLNRALISFETNFVEFQTKLMELDMLTGTSFSKLILLAK